MDIASSHRVAWPPISLICVAVAVSPRHWGHVMEAVLLYEEH
jgi:hypothetical protein